MDKVNFPRNKVCAGWITPSIIDVLQIDKNDYRQNHILQPINGFRISQIGSKQLETCYQGEPVSYGIRRKEFDHYLLQRCGARLYLDEPFKLAKRKANTWIVNNKIQAPLLVGAGGHFCPVARLIGAKVGTSELAVKAQEIEFEMTAEQIDGCNIKKDVPELFICQDLKGYGWVFRKDNYLNIGLGREDKHNLTQHVNAFCEYLKQSKKICFNISYKFNGHAYLLYKHSHRNISDDGVLLIGDSAGLAYAQSGEGIRPAIESGKLAAEVILEAQGDYSLNSLKLYQDLIVKQFGKRKSNINISEILPAQFKEFVARQLLVSRWFVRNIILDYWFLHSHH
jgi:flavin-dependent dehydrogenase